MHSSFARALRGWAMACWERPRWALLLSSLLLLLCCWLAATRLDLRMEWTYLFATDDPVVLKFEAARGRFPYPGDIVVLVDGGGAPQREGYIEELSARLQAEPELFFHVFSSWRVGALREKALYYLTVEQLGKFRDALSSPKVGRAIDSKLLTGLTQELLACLQSRGQSQPSLFRVLFPGEGGEQTTRALDLVLAGDIEIPLSLNEGRAQALVLKTGTRGSELAQSGKAILRLREILKDLQPQASGLRVRLTGLPVLLHDERTTCASDSLRTGALSLILVAIIFAVGFGQLSKPALSVLCLLYGLGWTAGYATLVVGHLNFITVTLASMLVGLGIDFTIHLLFRYEEELSHGSAPREALGKTMISTGLDNGLGALATAVAFLSLTLVNFRGLADLGVIASGGVLLCFVSSVTLLPALLSLQKQDTTLCPGVPPQARFAIVAQAEDWCLEHSKRICGVAVILLVPILVLAWSVPFRYNLLEVQDPSLESVRTEIEMISEEQRSSLTAAVIASTPKEAGRLVEALERLPAVESVLSLSKLLPDQVEAKQVLIEEIVDRAQSLELPAPIPLDSAADLLRLRDRAKGRKLLLVAGADPELSDALSELRQTMAGMGPGPVLDALRVFQWRTRQELSQALGLLREQQAVPPTPNDLPEELRIRTLSPAGEYLLTVSPRENIWQKEPLEEFLDQVSTVTPDLVGHPVVQEHILSSFLAAHGKASWLTLAGVCLVMALSLRRAKDCVQALLPTAYGVALTVGGMGLLGLSFNVVNFVALPISVGIGAVYALHSVHRMSEAGDTRLFRTSTGPGIALSGLTTLAGFGCLTLAHHRGIASLGWVVSLGVLSHLLVSLVLTPAMVQSFSTAGDMPSSGGHSIC